MNILLIIEEQLNHFIDYLLDLMHSYLINLKMNKKFGKIKN